jgi:hypothetical protein
LTARVVLAQWFTFDAYNSDSTKDQISMQITTPKFLAACFSMALCLNVAQATDKKTNVKKEAVVAKMQLQEAFVQMAKDSLIKCGEKYRYFLAMKAVTSELWQATVDSARAGGRSSDPLPPMGNVDPYHKICAQEEQAAMLPRARDYIDSYSANNRAVAKTVVAQWITAVDSIGKSIAASEQAKFETLVNGLKVDGL